MSTPISIDQSIPSSVQSRVSHHITTGNNSHAIHTYYSNSVSCWSVCRQTFYLCIFLFLITRLIYFLSVVKCVMLQDKRHRRVAPMTAMGTRALHKCPFIKRTFHSCDATRRFHKLKYPLWRPPHIMVLCMSFFYDFICFATSVVRCSVSGATV